MPATLLLLVVLVVTGCSAPSSRSNDAAATGQAPESAAGAKALASTRSDRLSASHAVPERAVISTGSIELVSSDVSATRTRLDAALSRLDGRVADEHTATDDHGTVTRSHLVVRVPSTRFDQAMTDLSGVASLRSSSRRAEDVTTQVIDIGARIAAERAGVRRLRDLVSHTASLGSLLAVERALTQRQGELESLRQQQAYLADQTSLATITVDVVRKVSSAPVEASAGGFVGGLRHGWHGLVVLVVAFLVAFGAVLPFAVLALLLGMPSWLVTRRMLRMRRLRTPAES
ncbi:MAG TPA: DUF4349 domain-containing protein [Nocardioides sp.]|uniref:DUF4349 domain-containing protein n=1 Tax=Nocardioides sp. TaxID=35761 RepID=UPI002E339AB4|nr:DUF4349 domain-containing protein [Nocardioides sp.]HEX3932106.1 DUF4349 domain-containing protein [Nocardioides sp.]